MGETNDNVVAIFFLVLTFGLGKIMLKELVFESRYLSSNKNAFPLTSKKIKAFILNVK